MNALEADLISRIDREGPITFRDFMEAALYHTVHGYYNTPRPKIGPLGDYYTSSNVHPGFGEVLAKAFAELWGRGRPPSSRLTLVEIGAGTGQLASDILCSLSGIEQVYCGLRYVIVERSEAMRALQKERLGRWLDRVEWLQMKEIAGQISGIIFSNELFDSLAVHRARKTATGWEEQYVTSTGNDLDNDTGGRRLALTWRNLSSSELCNYLQDSAALIEVGQIVEVNLGALDLLRQITGILASGFVVTIDYGDVAEHLYSPSRREGTLRSFQRHRLNPEPLDRAGERDITASVNFTALIEWGRDLGLELVSFERQTSFLMRMGLGGIVVEAAADESRSGMAGRLALKNLFVPGGVSDSFRVLIQKKILHVS